MKFLAFGAGAVGTYIGGSLALSGHEVVFIERPQVAETIRASGLRLGLSEGERQVASPMLAPSLAGALAAAASDGRPFDAAIFALKSFDTAAALEDMRPHIAAMPPVLCLQNGVDNEPALAGVLGSERVIAGTLLSAIARRGLGDIAVERLRGMGVAAGHPLSEALQAALDAAGLRCRLFPKAADMKWSKLLTNLIANASSAILDMTPAEIFAHPGLFRLEMLQLRETLEVMHAQSIDVVDLPGTPVRLLALGVRLPASLSRPLMTRAIGSGRGGKMPSFHIDLHAGRGQSEVDWLNGAVVRAGERLSIPTPANRLLNDTLLALTHGDIPLAAFAHQPKKLLEKITPRRE
jgi:2-dehydropantoate 2-reductase